MAKVTLCGTPSLVEGSQWPHFTFGLAECLPLRSLHWKSSSRPSIRTIQELDVTLSPYKDSHSDAGPHLTILDNSLLSIYVASCDVSIVSPRAFYSLVIACRTATHTRIPLRSTYKNGAL